MSPLGKPAKRQRPTDVKVVDSPSRPKRLKTDQELQIVHRKNATEPSSNMLEVAVKASSDWSFDLMFRGHIHDLDPIFSTDEKYLFLSRGDAIQVYSMSTHRPVKTLTTRDASHVTGLKLASSDSQHIYVSTSSGKLIRWNWETSQEVTTRSDFLKVVTYEIVSVKAQEEEEEGRMTYFAVKETKGRCNIITNAAWQNSADITILQNTNYINQLRVLQGGQVVVACGRQHIIIGTLRPSSGNKGQNNEYEWREFRLPVKQITCLDVQETRPATAGKDSNVATSINIAVGDASGAILVYNDALNLIGGDGAGLPLLQRLHWHREPVASLRWSRDGGKESVIVFWQLDSGRRNFLPHLPSPIRSITISSGGALYAVQLADKSITVISATELHSVATIDGLQLPSLVDTNDKAATRNLEGKYPAVIHPLQPERLLVAIPDGDSQSLSYLQTFNIQTGSHISRQALTRTNVTTLNKGPEGTPILPPSVELMELGMNGEWLATVDTWTPSQRDVEAVSSALHSSNVQRSEIFLKFWRWSEAREIWELAARVESPHVAASGEPAKVLSLKARPDRSEFVTFGGDGTLRVWQPVLRHGGSSRAQNRSDFVEHTWKSQHSVKLTGRNTANDANYKLPSRVMSFSEDGSIVAVCVKNVVHLIDSRQWTVNCSRNAFTSERIRTIGWLGRSLVILSELSLTIWDVVDNVLRTPVQPDMAGKGSSHKYIALAVDSTKNTFAVVTRMAGLVNPQGHNSVYGIAVYSPSTMATLFETVLEKPPLQLLADPSTGGYIVIDHAANIWRLGGGNSRSQALALPADENEQRTAAAGLGDIFGRLGQKVLEGRSFAAQQASSTLTLQSLGGIFDRAPPFALPPATALFKDVISSLVSSS
ncbi:hypothetical protein UA08_06255 [Talaromyces atroroseus]|uniref:WD repeat-containing protein 75 second beta-propeller domain-containing protein n=1 Tax=Talaromyces atroroseus TaxID=1441469 RepID=A0A225AVI5_TALAT|nr:hypothetical protein UA08_06255 [Talaromyces atroroseus]OKL58445.1 hypothetical protein UA08_06255 [Talaromyces atroroseus]